MQPCDITDYHLLNRTETKVRMIKPSVRIEFASNGQLA